MMRRALVPVFNSSRRQGQHLHSFAPALLPLRSPQTLSLYQRRTRPPANADPLRDRRLELPSSPLPPSPQLSSSSSLSSSSAEQQQKNGRRNPVPEEKEEEEEEAEEAMHSHSHSHNRSHSHCSEEEKAVAIAALRARFSRSKVLYPSEVAHLLAFSPSHLLRFICDVKERNPLEKCFKKAVLKHIAEEEGEGEGGEGEGGGGINEVAFFLESLGISASVILTLLPRFSPKLSREQALVYSVRAYESVGIHRMKLGSLLEKDSEALRYSKEEILSGKQAMEQLGIDPEDAVVIVLKCPMILRAEVTEYFTRDLTRALDGLPSSREIVHHAVRFAANGLVDMKRHQVDEILGYFRGFELPLARVDAILRRSPHFLFYRVDDLEERVRFFRARGISRDGICKIVNKYPSALRLNVATGLAPKFEFLRSLGLSDPRIAKLVPRFPAILGASVERKLKPAVAEFAATGMKAREIRKIVELRPSIFACKLGGGVSEIISAMKSISCSGKKGDMFVGLFEKGIAHKRFLEGFLSRQEGIEPSEASRLIESYPQILANNSKPEFLFKVNYVVSILKLSPRVLLSAPNYLCRGFDMGYLRRRNVLLHLKSEKLLPEEKDLSFEETVCPSQKQFFDQFVKPNLAKSAAVLKIWTEKLPDDFGWNGKNLNTP